MGLSSVQVKKELIGKNVIENNLFAWGTLKFIGGSGALFALSNPMYAFGMKDGMLAIIPFTNRAIQYEKGNYWKKESIIGMKIKTDIFAFGLQSSLEIRFSDDTNLRFNIMKPFKKDIKNIMSVLGF